MSSGTNFDNDNLDLKETSHTPHPSIYPFLVHNISIQIVIGVNFHRYLVGLYPS